ncbi:uncharacterized protein [Miscanthus floridulus]|uniref:uncharacterized protein n=1 Tax=Miscanthus floridulus TaxID=154761 RepID=UPI003457815E
MDCCLRVFYGGSVRKEDDMFEDMEEELEWFDKHPSFDGLCVRLNTKFGGDFIVNGRFDSGKTRAHYVLMPLCDLAHWSRYNRVLQGSNVPMAKVVVENGYMMQSLQDGPSNDGVGGNEQELGIEGEATQGNMDLDGQLTHGLFHSTPVGYISNDFDVNEFEREDEEEEEDRIGDAVSSDSDDSDNDQGGRDAMPTLIDTMPVPVHAMSLSVPTEVLHTMPAQGRLVTDLLEDDTPYDSWGRISDSNGHTIVKVVQRSSVLTSRV